MIYHVVWDDILCSVGLFACDDILCSVGLFACDDILCSVGLFACDDILCSVGLFACDDILCSVGLFACDDILCSVGLFACYRGSCVISELDYSTYLVLASFLYVQAHLAISSLYQVHCKPIGNIPDRGALNLVTTYSATSRIREITEKGGR